MERKKEIVYTMSDDRNINPSNRLIDRLKTWRIIIKEEKEIFFSHELNVINNYINFRNYWKKKKVHLNEQNWNLMTFYQQI